MLHPAACQYIVGVKMVRMKEVGKEGHLAVAARCMGGKIGERRERLTLPGMVMNMERLYKLINEGVVTPLFDNVFGSRD